MSCQAAIAKNPRRLKVTFMWSLNHRAGNIKQLEMAVHAGLGSQSKINRETKMAWCLVKLTFHRGDLMTRVHLVSK